MLFILILKLSGFNYLVATNKTCIFSYVVSELLAQTAKQYSQAKY